MLRFTLRSLFAHRRRASLTGLAVVLGVSMITGTLIFTATIDAAFHDLFGSSTKGAQVVVSSRQDIASAISAPADLPASLIRTIRRLPGVSAAQGQIEDNATIVGDNGRVLSTAGLPTLALSYLPAPFTGLDVIAGRRPIGSGEVAIDATTAAREHFHVGQTISIVTEQPVRRFRISGIVTLGSASLGGATVAVFDLGTARGLFDKPGRADSIYIAADHGVGAGSLLDEIRPLLDPQFVARTARAQTDVSANRISDQLTLLTGGLLAFGFVAVLVGAFVIFNTFSITVAQRAREFSVLRALGAMRRQVLLSVLAEAVMIGGLGSVLGLAGGLLAALLIHLVFNLAGLDLPSTGLVLRAGTAGIGIGVGVLVTLVAGVLPAIRATRNAPLESLLTSTAPRFGTARRWARLIVAALLIVVGLVVIFTGSGTTTARLQRSALGTVPVIVAVVLLGPLLVRALAGVVSWPSERGGRVVAKLARQNAVRNPARTALSASSLIIGLALVLFVTIYASGLRDSTRQIIRQSFIGDLTIQSQNSQTPIPAAVTQVAAGINGLQAISSLKSAPGRLGAAGNITAEAIDPTTIGQVYRFDWIDGSNATLTNLMPGQALLEQNTARAAHLAVGDRTTLVTETGVRIALQIAGIYSDRALLRGITLTQTQFNVDFDQPRLQDIFIKLAPGASRSGAASTVARALSAFPGVVVRSEHQLAAKVSGQVNQILILFYALLALSVVMSLLGIVNTLNLSVYERTRELGMLRAMGMTAGQARVLIRNEGLITAVIGSLVGVALGVFLAWVVIRSLSGEGLVFSAPWLQVLGVFAVGVLAGVLASILPARRAARLDVLAAIAHE
jgi:putative ABC transport system permease protein